MKNLEVKKIINNKLKLYRTSVIGTSALISVVATTSYVITPLLTINHPMELRVIINGLTAGLTAGLVYYLFAPDFSKYNDDIESLKEIKKDLKNGINKFQNVSEENFSEEFTKYKKMYIKNKVKLK